jgi:hypothetical protein
MWWGYFSWPNRFARKEIAGKIHSTGPPQKMMVWSFAQINIPSGIVEPLLI